MFGDGGGGFAARGLPGPVVEWVSPWSDPGWLDAVVGWVADGCPPSPDDPWACDKWLVEDGEARDPVPLTQLDPGADLASVLAGRTARVLSSFDLVEAAAGWQRLGSWVAAERAGVLAELAARPEMRPEVAAVALASVHPVSITGMEIAAALCLTCRQAENTVAEAVQLVEQFAGTHAALAAGQDPDVILAVEAAVLDRAAGVDTTKLRRLIKRALLTVNPA
ncbi:MAG: hypothetical protein ACRDVZ_11745, partial [Jiangellaceae bacterium]